MEAIICNEINDRLAADERLTKEQRVRRIENEEATGLKAESRRRRQKMDYLNNIAEQRIKDAPLTGYKPQNVSPYMTTGKTAVL